MPYSPLQEFIAKNSQRGGPAKASRFNVDFIGQSWSALGLTCEGAILPGRNFDVAPLRIYGVNVPMPTNTNYGEVTMTFLVMSDFLERDLFEAWTQLIQPSTDYDMAYPDDYKIDISINQYAEFGTTDKPNEPLLVYSTKLINAFPVGIGELQLNWAQDEVHRLNITFAYEKYTDAVGKVRELNEPADRALLADSVISPFAPPMEGPSGSSWEEAVSMEGPSGSSYENPPKMKGVPKPRTSIVQSIQRLTQIKQSLTAENIKNLAIGRALPTILSADNSFRLDENLSTQLNVIKETIGFGKY